MERLEARRPSLRIFHRLVLAAGVAALAILLWKLDVRSVLTIAGSVGWGFLPVILQGIIPLTLNASGWRLSFAPEEARTYSLTELATLWLAMDGVNYLVPTGTVAGEVARATMLRDDHPAEVRAASVVISRAGQTIAQLTCVLTGFVFLLPRIAVIRERVWIIATAAALLGLVVTAFGTYLFLAGRLLRSGDEAIPASRSDRWANRVPRHLRIYLGGHPWRFIASIGVFAAAYAWTTLEAWWICRCIGVPVTLLTALTIEVLSVAVDGLTFMVPAKVGAQELGKTAIFSLLGLPPRFGLAFGIVRHLRELIWAAAGFIAYGILRRRAARTRDLRLSLSD